MKKQKLLALVLSAALCVSAAAPVSAADFDQAAAAIAVETESAQEAETVDNADAENPSEDVVSETEESGETYTAERDAEKADAEDEAEDEEATEKTADEKAEQLSAPATEETAVSTQSADQDTYAIATQAAGNTVTLPANDGTASGITPAVANAATYRINLTTGGTLSLKMTKEYSQTIYVAILDADSEEYLSEYTNEFSTELNLDYELTKGSYLVKISKEYAFEDAKGNFTLKTKFRPHSGLTFAENSNDDFFSANTIALGQVVKGHLALNNTADYYKIEIPSTGRYNFIRQSVNGGAQNIQIYNSSYELVRKETWSYSSFEMQQELEKGTYYLKIVTNGKSYDSYWLRVVSHAHTFKTYSVRKATLTSNGSITSKCSDCGAMTTTTIYRPSAISLAATSYTYDGTAKKPGVTVTDASGKRISASSYTVSYDRNAASVGNHTVSVTFKGNYSGTVTRTYTIRAKAAPANTLKGTSVSKLSKISKGFKVKVKKQSKKAVTGYQVQYSTTNTFQGAKTKTFKGTSQTVKKLKKKTVYYVRVRTYKKSGKNTVYSAWSAVKSVKTK